MKQEEPFFSTLALKVRLLSLVVERVTYFPLDLERSPVIYAMICIIFNMHNVIVNKYYGIAYYRSIDTW